MHHLHLVPDKGRFGTIGWPFATRCGKTQSWQRSTAK